jgi:hypothetical protein
LPPAASVGVAAETTVSRGGQGFVATASRDIAHPAHTNNARPNPTASGVFIMVVSPPAPMIAHARHEWARSNPVTPMWPVGGVGVAAHHQ